MMRLVALLFSLLVLLVPLWANAAPDGYRLVWEDNFDGDKVDPAKWRITYDGNPDWTYDTYQGTPEKWPSTNMRVSDGVLSLIVSKHGDIFRTMSITTQPLWTHGYFEARVLAPAGPSNGIGANFWSNSEGWVFPEIDIWEWSGTRRDRYKSNWHDGSEWAASNTLGSYIPGSWNIVAMEWTADRIRFSVNGSETASLSTKGRTIPPQWLLLGATVGPFGDRVDDTTVLPAVYRVDYVRVYQR